MPNLKKIPGLYLRTSIKKGMGREGWEGRERSGKGRGKDGRGWGYAISNILSGVVLPESHYKGQGRVKREGRGESFGVELRGLGGYWQRDTDEETVGREGTIKMKGPRERHGTGPPKCNPALPTQLTRDFSGSRTE
jgi:hypothetical protein